MAEKKKYIRRATHSKENPYFLVRRDTMQDRSLSYEARGMLAYILSKPDTWRVQPSELIQDGCGRDKVYRILSELIRHHYIEHEKSFNEAHKIVWGDYVVHECPPPQKAPIPYPEKADMVSPSNPFPEIPYTENTDIREYRALENKEKISLPSGKGRKADPEFDVISEVWGIRSGGWVSNMQGMMFGSKKVKGEWLQCQFTPPATIREVADFEAYARKRMTEKNIADMPTAPETIQRWFDDFRAGKTNNGKPKVSAARLALEEILKVETPIRRPLDNPPNGGYSDDSD